MRRIAAGPPLAQVIQYEPERDRPDQSLEDVAVRLYLPTLVVPDLDVPTAGRSAT